MSSNKKPLAVALGTALAGGLVLGGSAFAMTPLAQGYMLAATSADASAQEGDATDKAKEASAEAKQLQSEINDLLAQAARIRKGEAGAGAKAEERRAKGMSPEAADAAATKKAQSAADEANYYAALETEAMAA